MITFFLREKFSSIAILVSRSTKAMFLPRHKSRDSDGVSEMGSFTILLMAM